MGYKMVFSDMDGTLLRGGTEISVENSAAIRKAVDKGVEFVLCTGRGIFGVERFLKELGLMGKNGYAICQNGATVYDLRTMQPAIRRSFPPGWFAETAKCAREMGLELYYYDDRNFMTEHATKMVEKYCKVMRTEMRILKNPEEYDGEFTKCLASGPRERLSLLREKMQPLLAGKLDTFFSSEIYLEFVRTGVNKGNALAETAEKAGVPVADVIAIGDSDNDRSMILRAGLGVAVRNAEEDVKAIADYVTEHSCEENAVAEVLEKFVLRSRDGR